MLVFLFIALLLKALVKNSKIKQEGPIESWHMSHEEMMYWPVA